MSLEASLIDALEQVVGERGLIRDATRRRSYECDGLAIFQRDPQLVVLPRSTEETSEVMRLLWEYGVTLSARGAGTGLAGGATPEEDGVVLSLMRMKRVIEIDPFDRRAHVEAGLVNIDLSRLAAPHGLFYAPDPSSQMACTLGGNVANNSGGPHCFRYGNTQRHLLGAKIVLHDGQVLDLTDPEPDPIGMDLTGVFCGSEGTLGVATELVFNLEPIPEKTETVLGIFDDLDKACDAVSDAIAQRLEPSAIEILDKLTIEAVEDSVFAAGYPREAEAVLLCDVEGSAAAVEESSSALDALMRQHGAIECKRAADEGERKRLWAGRKGAFGAMGRVAPDLYVADAVVPRAKLRELVGYTVEVARERGLKLATVFHAGDGNLHPNICYDRRDPDELKRVLEAGDLILSACVDAGGSLTGEHGVGLEKRDHMCHLFDQEDLDAFGDLRRAFDPDLRMNPTKLLPVRRCQELHGDTPPGLAHGEQAP